MRLTGILPPLAPLATLIALLVLAPLAITDLEGRLLLVLVVIYILLSVSWNLTLGYAGVFNFAHLAFFAVGAYTVGIGIVHFEFSPWLSLALSAPVGAIAAAIAFTPSLRVKGIYVALLTFIFAQLLHQLVLSQGSLTGGSSGLVGLPPLELGGTVFADNGQLGYYALGGAVLVVVMAGLTLLTRSAFGLSLMALRDEEEYARSRGVPLFRQHLLAFILSGVIASIAGGIYAFVIGVVSPELFGFGYVSLVLSMVFLGGAGTLWGPVAGAVVITVISDRLRNDGPWQYIVVSVIILVVLWLFPGGLAGLLAKAQQLLGGRRFGRRTAPEPERVSS